MEKRDSYCQYIQYAIRDNWNRLSLTDFDGISLQYRDVARKIAKLHILYKKAGIEKGDRIALIGKNSSHWAIAFLSITTYGAVAVPILNDFHIDNIHHLINHSESKLVFADLSIWKNIKEEKIPQVTGVLSISDFSLFMSRNDQLTEARKHLNMLFGEQYPERFTEEDVVYQVENPDDIAIINYTSGSTGFSKGVMLSYRVLWSNLQFCIDGLTFLKPGDGVVCMLPLAHMFGLMVDLIHCFSKGCHINFLTRLPSPKVIFRAFAEVKPKLIVSVPLIIEKIIRTKVIPELKKPTLRVGMMMPGVHKVILNKIRQNIIDAFGGELMQLIIGGASLSKDVETLLREIKFPVTVGYGMTECGPLIAYAPWDVIPSRSCGRIVDRMECRIDSDDPTKVPGVLWVKGDNVMTGYYKNEEATSQAFDNDGWMSTGDICTIDKDGFLYIRGRAKTMILGPSGQNIYPEEVEQVLSNMPYVAECLVISEGKKIVALIYPDYENEDVKNMSESALHKAMEDNIVQLNSQVPVYSKVNEFRLMADEFEKTPKRSIKRYLYQK